jgi:hypothetical protein
MQGLVRTLFQDAFRVRSRSQQTLERIQRGREWLSVYLPGDSSERMTTLLHLDPAREFILLDEPSPVPEHVPERGGEVFFLGLAAGVYAGLRCVYEGRVGWHGRLSLRLRWPHAVYHLQRRSHLRVPVESRDVLDLELLRKGLRSVRADCVDLSISGMRVRLKTHEDEPFAVNDWLDQVCFKLDRQAVNSPALVRFVQSMRPAAHHRATHMLGLQFQQLHPRQEMVLQRYVFRRDRELVPDSRL